MKPLNLKNMKILDSFKKITAPIIKHHLVIIILAVLGFLIFVVINVNQIINSPADQDYLTKAQAEQAIKTQFDQKTINGLKALKDRQEDNNLDLPSGRISPFKE